MRRLPRRVVLSEIPLCVLKSKPQTIDGLASGIIHQPPVDLPCFISSIPSLSWPMWACYMQYNLASPFAGHEQQLDWWDLASNTGFISFAAGTCMASSNSILLLWLVATKKRSSASALRWHSIRGFDWGAGKWSWAVWLASQGNFSEIHHQRTKLDVLVRKSKYNSPHLILGHSKGDS